MRTTITVDDRVYAVVRSLARQNQRSIGRTIELLLQRGLLAETGGEADAELTTDPDTGFPLIRSERPITDEDIRSLEDDR